MEENKEIFTKLSIEEFVWNTKIIIVAINSGEIPDLRSVASKLEALVGQKLNDDGTWCPPTCTPSEDLRGGGGGKIATEGN